MALPEIIKDIESRVKDTGDIMTGKLTILTNNKTVTFGCDNTQMAHYYTDAAIGLILIFMLKGIFMLELITVIQF